MVINDKPTRPSLRSCRYSSSAESRWTTISIYSVPSEVKIIVNKKLEVPWIEIISMSGNGKPFKRLERDVILLLGHQASDGVE